MSEQYAKRRAEAEAWVEDRLRRQMTPWWDKPARVWFYRPSVWWFGWRTLLPYRLGCDEHNRRVLSIGWAITGQLNIALRDCRVCAEAERTVR